MAGPMLRYKLSFKSCAHGNCLSPLTQLSGAAHAQSTMLARHDEQWQPCDRVTLFAQPTFCRQPTNLSLQFLRVCRQIHNEAALIPYHKTSFIIDPDKGLRESFDMAFRNQFSKAKRAVFETVAIWGFEGDTLKHLPSLFPGLKRLWIDAGKYVPPSRRRPIQAKRFRKLIEVFLQAGGPSLESVWVKHFQKSGQVLRHDVELMEALEQALLRRCGQ